MLQASGLQRVVGGRRLVDGVSATFAPGRIALIIGPNGAGKSTLVKLLSGQVRADAGSVRYGDTELRALTPGALARVRAVLSQSVAVAFPLRVWEVVMMGRYPHGGHAGAQDERICQEVMEYFGVAGMAQRDYLTLSGGEKQRVHFARVLAQLWAAPGGPTRYLFLDEPLASLDIPYQLDFMKKLRELTRREQLVVVGVLHDLNLAARFADDLLLMHEGRALVRGPQEEVLTPGHIRSAFGIEPRVLRLEDGSVHLAFE
ncbi:heme ABC transporter ATP-binding protein [Aggregicoccus sp. 17bor-14]|uniref:heme ABC transporter ATP-binding protein n=1 Tax=Myxococcaceae TaxID=31 RepID=UPI00129CA5FC|nr:heme ABC transporter ATP-binding protein [Simulacricoccus sp. 17bor-14]MRI87706.1 heme ABC transporter ATP-binding protein [Aggregicoccus sp. 17bor-14]